MKTVCNLMDDNADFPSLENSAFVLAHPDDKSFDVVVCAIDQIEYASALANPDETFFIVVLSDVEHEKGLIPSSYHAWISRHKLERLPDMLETYSLMIDQKNKTRESRAMVERFMVDTSVHHANLDGIKKSMRESTKEIEMIFEARVEDMRNIHKDTARTLEHLTQLKEQIAPKEFANLEESWNMTRAIVGRTDDVIKAMFGFISVLQCEDRISQMVDGISTIMDDDIQFAQDNGYFVAYGDEVEFKTRLMPYYTIQDQRDYVMGHDDAMKGCKPESVDIDDFILF